MCREDFGHVASPLGVGKHLVSLGPSARMSSIEGCGDGAMETFTGETSPGGTRDVAEKWKGGSST